MMKISVSDDVASKCVMIVYEIYKIYHSDEYSFMDEIDRDIAINELLDMVDFGRCV